MEVGILTNGANMKHSKDSHLKGCRVLHIGGHKGQEIKNYRKMGVDFTYVEADPKYARILRKKGCDVIECAVTSKRGEMVFYLGEKTQRSSLKKPHKSVTGIKDKIVVECKTLEDIQDGYDGLSIDAQGESYDILSSGDLSKFRVIICEASEKPRYEGEKDKQQIHSLMDGFTIVDEYRHKNGDIYDVVYRRSDTITG